MSSSTRKRTPSRLSLSTPSRKRPQQRQLGFVVSNSSAKSESSMTGEITALEITKRATSFFGERAVQQPCVSARLFACYSLHVEMNEMNATEERTTRKTHSQKCIEPILPLLQSLVDVELESFGDLLPQMPHKRIHFSGFDCSSTLPPVDRINGSESHQQESIHALKTAKDQVEALQYADKSHVKPCLESLLQFLKETLLDENAVSMLQECAKSIGFNYPQRRIQKAVQHTQTELETVLARLVDGNQNMVLAFERRLAEFCGQAIRFQLRMLFNVAPPRLSPLDELYEERAKSFSQVYYHVEMELKEGIENLAVGDGCISALISKALEYLYCYVGREHLLDASRMRPEIPVLFCSQPATNRGISIRGEPTPITPNDMTEIESDIAEATSFLAATSGCRFLYQLFSVSGVQEEIARQGGWEEVETYASLFWKYHLWELCPEDAHLVVLANYDALFAKLESYLNAMEPLVKSCEDSVAAVAKRFRTKTKSQKLLEKYPQIRVIATQVEEGLQKAHFLPSVKAL